MEKLKTSIGAFLKSAGLEKGVKVDTNPETAGSYHSNWLSMMYSRWLLARHLRKDDGVICINGAAARKVQVNDIVIIIAYGLMNEDEVKLHKPKTIFVNDKNQITEVVYGQKGSNV